MKIDKITAVANLKEGMENVILLVYVSQAYTFSSKKGERFSRLILNDQSGSINGFLKSPIPPKNGAIIRVRGNVGNYNGSKTFYLTEILNTYTVEELPPEAKEHLFPSLTSEELKNIENDLRMLIDRTSDNEIKRFLKAVFFGENLPEHLKNILGRIWYYPAASKIHHARIGGLIQHSVKAGKLVEKIAAEYKDIVIRDIAVAGALIHDIGKILEQKEIPGTGWTKEGELLGHIAMGYELLIQITQYVPMSNEKLIALKHIILSHHGEREKGSPVVPLTPEALIVHTIEDLESHMDSIIGSAPDSPGRGQTQNAFSKRVFYYHLGRD